MDYFSSVMHISPIVDHIVTFLLPIISDNNELLESWTGMSTKTNDMFYLLLSSVCKKLARTMENIQQRFLCPYVSSERNLLLWFQVMPSLANICLSRDFWALRKFLYLRTVYFSKTGQNKWQTVTMLDVNKSH